MSNQEKIDILKTEFLENASKMHELKRRQKEIFKEAGNLVKSKLTGNCILCTHLGFDFEEVGIQHKCNCKK